MIRRVRSLLSLTSKSAFARRFSLFTCRGLTTTTMDSRSTTHNPSDGTPVANKASKFKPAIPNSLSKPDPSRRVIGLAAFSTPGFQTTKQYPNRHPVRQDAISISSDSAPSSPGKNSIKRHSSGYTIPDELSPPVKRLKKTPDEGKENIFQMSTAINVSRPSEQTQLHIAETTSSFSDPTPQLSLQTLMQFQIYALELSKQFSQEALAYHSGTDVKKDMSLIEGIKNVIDARLEVIDSLIKQQIRHRTDPLGGEVPSVPLPKKINEEPKALYRDTSIVVDNIPHQASGSSHTRDAKTDTDYWEGVEEIPMDFEAEDVTASSSTTQTLKENEAPLTSSSFYAEIRFQLSNVFKLTDFRPNQLGAITATLEGKDAFVLMPTGGGKSLCYQLPAVCTTGKTTGVTVVVSPLLALMKDQVNSLIAKDVKALLSNSETGGDDWNRLIMCKPKPSLWYLTPEKLRDSGKVNDILARLYKDQSLARFVIDEAHCISTWGQDFRDAYTSLGSLRDKYPDVPIMALTATANKRTVCDIISQLNLRKDHASFTQSFNRTNLSYIVKTKRGSPFSDIMSFITTKHQDHAGIIYCLARQTCETVAKNLRDKGLSAAHFHAGMSTLDKDQVAEDWQLGKLSIIVATIAFGMGIDKSNVRFVIHFDMPKTLSGYYQETGRAGRDGEQADCLMFYSGHDLYKLRNQIQKSEDTTEESKRRQEAAVKEVYEFCKKISVCRRVQLLRHFDEDFDRELCRKGCDTCQDDRETVSRDVSTYTRNAIALAKKLYKERITFVRLADILRGSKMADIINKGQDKHPEYGSCHDLPKELFDLMLDELLYLGLLTKSTTQNASGFHTEYLSIGDPADDFMRSKQSIVIDWRPTTTSKGTVKQPKQRKAAPTYVVDAPPRSRKGKKKAVEEDPIECYDDMYADDLDDSHFDNIPELSTPSALNIQSKYMAARSMATNIVQASSSVVMAKAPATLTSNGSDPMVLYKQMIKLRDDLMLRRKITERNDVFSDEVLQYLSILCPTDYIVFRQNLIEAIGNEMPDADEYANSRWKSFGQSFLQLCIQHRTAALDSSTTPPPQVTTAPVNLRSKYEYRPEVAGPSSMSISTSAPASTSYKPKGKFKPSVKPPSAPPK